MELAFTSMMCWFEDLSFNLYFNSCNITCRSSATPASSKSCAGFARVCQEQSSHCHWVWVDKSSVWSWRSAADPGTVFTATRLILSSYLRGWQRAGQQIDSRLHFRHRSQSSQQGARCHRRDLWPGQWTTPGILRVLWREVKRSRSRDVCLHLTASGTGLF